MIRRIFHRLQRARVRRSATVSATSNQSVVSSPSAPPPSPPPQPPSPPPRQHRPPPAPIIRPLNLSELDDGIRRSGYTCGLPSNEIPHSFRCPITTSVMSDPVILPDGFSYEREAISRWLDARGTSPCTGKPFEVIFILPNHTLRDAIREVCDA